MHINTICREEAKKLAPWYAVMRKVPGGFVAYENRKDAPKPIKLHKMKTGNIKRGGVC